MMAEQREINSSIFKVCVCVSMHACLCVHTHATYKHALGDEVKEKFSHKFRDEKMLFLYMKI